MTAAAAAGALVARGLRKTYPTPGGELVALDRVDLELAPGDALAIMGPSGSGKSTLLHVLGTLDTPTAGQLELGGTNPFALSGRNLAAFRNRSIGFVFQEHHLLPQLTALENVLVPTLAAATAAPDVEAWARTLLARVGLAERLEHLPGELSGGERQRVAIARALIHRPLLLLCDEPTGNLDAAAADVVGRLFLDLHRELRGILVVVTHSEALAGAIGRRTRLRDGRLEGA